MKKGFLIILSAVLLITSFLFTACDSWMQDDDFYSDIENDVKVANATPVSVYVRYANSKMGTTDPSGYVTMKEDVPFQLSAVTSDDYGFVRWTAFSISDFDPSKQHSTLFYDNAEEYEKNFAGLELPSAEVVFSDPTSLSTSVTLETTRSDIFITPLVAKRPAVVTSVPSNGRTDVVRNSQIRVLFSKPIDPASLVDEFGNSNIQVTSGSAVLTESASDVGSKDITDYFNITLSATKKLLTISLKNDANGNPHLMDGNSQISIIISEDVCDTDGFTMNGKHTFQFTTGTKLDSLAPQIEILTAGIGNDCKNFQQFYNPAAGQPVHDGEPVYTAHAEAMGNTLSAYEAINTALPDTTTKLLTQRVKDKVNIYVKARDIAGSGQFVTFSDEIVSESDVALLQVRASLYIDKDGNPVTTSQTAFANNSTGESSTTVISQRDIPYAMGMKDPDCQITTAFESIYGDTPTQNNPDGPYGGHGTVFTYDLSSLDDGLIKIDIWAVDMVGNDGLSEAYATSDQVWYNNGYRSIFVIKDSTAPVADSANNMSAVHVNLAGASTDGYFKQSNYSLIKIDGDASTIVDNGNPSLVSKHNDMKWIVKPASDPVWAAGLTPTTSGWASITSDYSGFTRPSSDGPVTFRYALMDDLGNISAPVNVASANYDGTNPVIRTGLTWTPEAGSTAGEASSNILDTQTLVIPVTEGVSGIKSIDFTVTRDGGAPYGSVLTNAIEVKAGSSTLVRDTDYTITGNKLSFVNPTATMNNFNSNITVRKLKISDAAQEGAYTVSVKVTDAADNETTTTNVQKAVVNIDTVEPEIIKIEIPNIKKARAFGGTSDVYWLTNPTGGRAYIDITFNEATSGARVFNFGTSSDTTVALTSDSMIYRLTSAGAIDGIAIPSSVNTSANTLTITNPSDTIRNDAGTNSVTVRITDVQLAATTADSKLSLKIQDKATKTSDAFNSITSGTLTGITAFVYNSATPAAGSLNLVDRGTDDSDENHIASYSSDYTSERYVNGTFYLNNSSPYAPVYQIILDGDVEFETDSTSTNKTTLYSVTDSAEIAATDYEFTDNKTITFKNSGVYQYYSGQKNIRIHNLKLTTGDATKTVKIKLNSLSDLTGSFTTDTIVMDTTPPEWNGKGLYTYYDTNNTTVTYVANVYPHPIYNGKAWGITRTNASTNQIEVNSAGNPVLYFYENTANIWLYPDASDTNLRTSNFYFEYIDSGSGSSRYDSSFKTGYHGHYKVFATDYAGNKSSIIDCYIVRTTALRDGIDTLENSVDLIAPAGLEEGRNSRLNPYQSGQAYNSSNYVFFDDTSANIFVYNYVLKKGSNNWTLKVPVHDYTKGDGTYAPVEKYAIVHRFNYFASTTYNTDPFIPVDPTTWHNYLDASGNLATGTTNTTSQDKPNISSCVDENGDIIITIPNQNCPPLVLFLKDGCGNTKYVWLNPDLRSTLRTYKSDNNYELGTYTGDNTEVYGKRNETVAWLLDGEVGSVVGSTNYNRTDLYSYYSSSESYMTKKSDTTFYKVYSDHTNTVTFGGSYGFSDMCRYEISSSGVGTSSEYSMRSRLMAWTGSGTPTQADFEAATTPTASAWYYMKESLGNGNFSLKNELPQFISADANGYGVPYKLYYIIEDRVGNASINQLKNSSVENWLFDNTPPSLAVSNVHNVNTVDGKNYFNGSATSNAYVEYVIEDKMSGIAHNGSSAESYPSFEGRTKLYNPTSGYSLKGITTSTTGDNLSIDGVKDWAGNNTDSYGLAIGSANLWINQNSAPVLASDCVTASRPNTSQPDITSSDIEDVTVTGITDKGKKLPITGSKKCTKIDVTLRVTDTTKLLGWYTTKDQLSSFAEFYTEDDIQDSNTATLGEGKTISYDATSNSYTYSFEKKKANGTEDDAKSSWNSKFGGEWYFYPVNRAGLICKTPVVIEFVNNPVPSVKEDTITYSGVVNYGAGTEAAVNYTKSGTSGSYVEFETLNSPQHCYFIWGTGNSDKLLVDLSSYKVSGSDNHFKVPLANSTVMAATTFANKQLKLQVLTTTTILGVVYLKEDSDEYDLGVAADGTYNKTGVNKWTFDETAPTVNAISTVISNKASPAAPVAAVRYPNNTDGVYYIDCDNAFVALSSSATDIDYWEWDNGSGEWGATPAKITLSSVTLDGTAYNGYSFAVPEQSVEAKTYQFRAVDKAGNKATAKTVKLRKDNEGPVLKAGHTTFAYTLKNGSTDAISKYFKDSQGDSANIRNIRYNVSNVTKLYLDYSCVEDISSGIEGYYYNNTKLSSGSTKSFDLPNTNGATAAYIVKVIDNVNHTTEFVTINLIADNNRPTIEVSSVKSAEGETSVTVMPLSDKYWIKGDNAIINLTGTFDTIGEGNDFKEYQWDQGLGASSESNWETITLDSGAYTIASSKFETQEKTYNFRALDTTNNVSYVQSVTLQKDSTPPTMTGPFEFTVMKDSTQAQIVDPSHTVAAYKVAISGSTTTITYNKDNVNNIVFTTTNISDEASGDVKLYRRVSGVSGTTDTEIASNTIALTDSMTAQNATYVLIAKDHAGNTLALGTFVFVADSTGPVVDGSIVSDQDPIFPGYNMLHSYSARKPKADGTGYDSVDSIGYVTVEKIGNKDKSKANLCINGTQIMYAKSLITDAVKYQIVMTESTGNDDTNNGFTATPASNGWLDMVDDGTPENTATNYIFTLPEVHAHHKRLALFFMDSLGNASDPYYIGNMASGQFGIQWWLTTPELSASNITISNVTLLNDSTKVGWQGVTKDYLVSIKLPKNAVVHSLELAPPKGNNNTGVVYALGASNEIKDQIFFTGYTPKDAAVTELSTAAINLADSADVGLQLKIYVWDKNKDNGNIGWSDPKIKINGIELQIFPAESGGFSSIGTTGGRSFIPAGITRHGDNVHDTRAEEAPKSRLVQFINTVTDNFSADSDFTADSSVTEKPAKKAKKAAKKAKKQANKASAKVVSTGSTTAAGEKPAMSVEAAEIIEQTLTSNVPEVAVAGESVVSEIAGVTEKINAAEQVVSIRPTGYSTTAEANSSTAEAEATTADAGDAADVAEKKTPSKSASIVIMLAILSSFSAVWYLQRNRKK